MSEGGGNIHVHVPVLWDPFPWSRGYMAWSRGGETVMSSHYVIHS